MKINYTDLVSLSEVYLNVSMAMRHTDLEGRQAVQPGLNNIATILNANMLEVNQEGLEEQFSRRKNTNQALRDKIQQLGQ